MAAPWDGRLATFLGYGPIGSRPATPNTAPGLLCIWYDDSAGGFSFYESVAAAWTDFPIPQTVEETQDMIATMLVAGTNMTLTYDDVAGTLVFDGKSNESIQDLVAALLVAGTNITIVYDDPSNTLTINATQRTDESIQDMLSTFLVAGTNVTLTYDDVANTLAIAATGGGSAPTESIVIAVGDESTAITTGTAKVTFRMPYAFTVTGVRASLTTASSSGNPTVDINESGVSILSTKLSIDSGEKTSTTAATPAVISDASLADDAEITIDIDTAGTGATGLKVVIIGHQ